MMGLRHRSEESGRVFSIPHPDRRQRARGGSEGEPERGHLLSMILGTYREMPGLRLHVNQAARLFGVPRTTCELVLGDLVRNGQLRRGIDGQYTRP